jgi:hypothetical protein
MKHDQAGLVSYESLKDFICLSSTIINPTQQVLILLRLCLLLFSIRVA